MKPLTRWIVLGGIVLVAAVVLSIVAARQSPVSSPGGKAPEPAAAPDGGAAPPEVNVVAAESLVDPDASFQVVLLPLGARPKDALGALRALARTGFPELRVQASSEDPGARPVALVGEIDSPGISDKELELFGRGLDAAAVRALERPGKAIVVEVLPSPGALLPQLRKAQALLRDAAVKMNVALYDVESREYFGADAWVNRRVATWAEDLPEVPAQISIQTYPVDEGRRSVTFGMAKFGLPDLVIRRHPGEQDLALGLATVMNLAAQALVERGRLDSPSRLTLRISDLRQPTLKENTRKLMRGHAAGETTLVLSALSPGEGDPSNRLLQITFADGAAGTQAMQATVRGLFGP